MRLVRLVSSLCIGSALALGAAGCSEPAATCAPDAKASALFTAEAAADAPQEIVSALNAGRALEAASQNQAAFDEKIRVIAKDPKLSEQWAKTLKVSGDPARTAAQAKGVPADLPLITIRLRATGVPNEEIVKVIDTAAKAKVPNEELAVVFHATATSAEKDGPIEDVGYWLSEKIQSGVRGEALEKEVQSEHKTRGAKILKAEEAAGKKVTVCHKPPGNPANQKTLEVGASALKAHLAHGDTEGACGSAPAGGKPDEAGKPDDKGKPDEAGKSDDKGKPEDKGKPAEAGKPADPGKPAEAGKPADKGKPADPGKSKGK